MKCLGKKRCLEADGFITGCDARSVLLEFDVKVRNRKIICDFEVIGVKMSGSKVLILFLLPTPID